MSFSENLKTVRKERNLSQEELAELLNVSRQAVSRWEQGIGYPEVEKLVLLSKQLNVSLDFLLSGETGAETVPRPNAAGGGQIMIQSEEQKAVVNCYKVLSTPMFKSRPDEPKYALMGGDGVSFWGENTTLLGWYADEVSITREINAIMAALERGEPSYTLQYAASVRHTLFSVKLVEQAHG